MPPRRAQRGGQFGGGVQAEANRGTNYSAIFDTIINGGTNAFHMAAARRIQENKTAQEAKIADAARKEREADKLDAQTYRDNEAKYRREQNKLAQDRQREVDATARADAALRQENDEFERQERIKAAAAAALLPKAPVAGTPEAKSWEEWKSRNDARFRTPAREPQPQLIPFEDGTLRTMRDGQMVIVYDPNTGSSSPSVARETQPVGPTRQMGSQPSPNPFGASVNPFSLYGGTQNGGAPPQAAPAQSTEPQRQLGARPMSTVRPATRAALPTTQERTAAAMLATAEPAFAQLETILSKGQGVPSWSSQQLSKVGIGAGNVLTNDEFRQMEQATNQLMASYLNLISGKAVSEQEVIRTAKAYVPLAGDDPATLEQKRQARAGILRMIRTAAGRAAPPQDNDDAAAHNLWRPQ